MSYRILAARTAMDELNAMAANEDAPNLTFWPQLEAARQILTEVGPAGTPLAQHRGVTGWGDDVYIVGTEFFRLVVLARAGASQIRIVLALPVGQDATMELVEDRYESSPLFDRPWE